MIGAMAKAHRTFVSYIDKSREYYAALGYDAPYKWATNTDAPFEPLGKPLSECRVAVVTTASRSADAPLEPYTAPSQPAPESLATDHLFWHKDATDTDDLGAYLPLDHLAALADDDVIGSLAPRFAGIPTIYSQRRTNRWAETIREELAADGVDLAVLTPL